MKETLKFINQLIANSSPDSYDSISYGKYYKDLTNISNLVLKEKEELDVNKQTLLKQVLLLPESEVKNNILSILTK